jgi:hypothetical protein
VPVVIIGDDSFFKLGPTPNEMDQAVAATYPVWEDFRQVVYTNAWTTGQVYDQAAYGGPEYGVNPSILMIATNMRLDWRPPPDGNLYLRAKQAAKELYVLFGQYLTDESVREAYPSIGNAATYSLFRFLGKDLHTLDEWCTIYQTMFGATYPLSP